MIECFPADIAIAVIRWRNRGDAGFFRQTTDVSVPVGTFEFVGSAEAAAPSQDGCVCIRGNTAIADLPWQTGKTDTLYCFVSRNPETFKKEKGS